MSRLPAQQMTNSDDEFSSDGDSDHIFTNFSIQSICGIKRY